MSVKVPLSDPLIFVEAIEAVQLPLSNRVPSFTYLLASRVALLAVRADIEDRR